MVYFQARWIGLGRICLASLSSVLEVWKPSQIEVRTGVGSFHRILKCNQKCCVWLSAVSAAAPQSNPSFLEIDHFRETATGSVNLRQYFHQNCKNPPFFSRNPVVPSELECLVSFLFHERLKYVTKTCWTCTLCTTWAKFPKESCIDRLQTLVTNFAS